MDGEAGWWTASGNIGLPPLARVMGVGRQQQANSVQCTACIKWIHKRCSGVRGDLSLVAYGLMCKRCDGTIQEADLAGDLGVDGDI